MFLTAYHIPGTDLLCLRELSILYWSHRNFVSRDVIAYVATLPNKASTILSEYGGDAQHHHHYILTPKNKYSWSVYSHVLQPTYSTVIESLYCRTVNHAMSMYKSVS